MQAITATKFGPAAEVFARQEVPDPQPGPGEVLIRVAGSSVNPIDLKIRSGAVPPVAPEAPMVLGCDVAGTIERLGEGVANLAVGDEVYACAGGIRGFGGALAERMVADAALVAPRPASLSSADAAVVPLVGITAWEALVDRARVQPGQRVLVHGGTGGVGHVGVQLARAMGATVYATVSSDEKARIARDLGADVTIDYRRTPVEQYVQEHTGGAGFEVVFDTVGGDNLAASFQAVATSGTVATIVARATQDLSPLHARNVTFHAVFMLIPMLHGRGRAHHGQILRRLAALIDAGRIRPLIDERRFGFTQVAAAHERLEAGEAVGKIALHCDLS